MIEAKKYIIKTELIGKRYKRKRKFNPILSIGILSFFRVEETKKCIRSLMRAFKPCDFEIVVLDNNSDEATRSELIKLADGNDIISLIFCPANLGVGRGRNVLTESSAGEYVLFLDNDCTVSKNFLTSLYNEISSDEKLGVVFSKIMEKDHVITRGRKIVLIKNRLRIDYSNDKLKIPDSRGYMSPDKIDIAPGGATIYRKKLLEDIGFDSNFYHHEDWDIMLSARKQGYRIKYCPLAVMFHFPSFDQTTEYGRVRRDMSNITSSDEALKKKWKIERM